MNSSKTAENGDLDQSTPGHVRPNCNECNEVTPRLAIVAKNALLNGDFPRVIAILDQLAAPEAIAAPLRRPSGPGRPGMRE